MDRRQLVFAALFIVIRTVTFSQTIIAPNSAMKSHETLDITKIVMSEDKTTIYLKVENRITGGAFCADKNIYLVYPDGTRDHLVSSNGIPVCPDSYKFKEIGEKLDFVLVFPAVRKGVHSVNLLEECSDNCFSFYGIILDASLNKKIDEAFSYAENDEPAKALVDFTKMAEETSDKTRGVDGLFYLNIIQLSRMTGNNVKAAEWYKKLETSTLPDKALYLKHLNSIGIKY
jgi:hypothetical protein